MKNKRTVALVLIFAFTHINLFAFQGTLTISFTNEKKEVKVAEVKVSDSLVYIKQTRGGNAKYDYFVLNLRSKDFYTVSSQQKKVVIKYQVDKLLAFYEAGSLKAGFRKNYSLDFKATDKAKEEDGIKLAKVVAENENLKVTAWIGNVEIPVGDLIPLLRLLGNWNESQAGNQVIIEADVLNKVSKKESTVKVAVKKEIIAKEVFSLPKNYLQKDFAKLIEENSARKDLKTIIQAFAEF